ncbi:MAG: lysophospholipase [Anaerolineae bacterium]|nr:lysophospholipase [Anaerolineae bacterium]
MGHSTGTLQSADGLELYYQRWYPDTEPRARIAILHGIGGHSGQSTFTHLIDHLVPLGYTLYGLDLRGHGRSEGRRGSVNSWEQYRSDLRLLLQMIKGTGSDQPVFLLGQSLGGLIVLEYALRYQRDVQGVIAAAPALSVPNTSPVLATLAKLLSPVLPHLVISPNFDLSGFSRDPEEVQKLLDDPLTDPRGSPRLAVETLSALEWTQAHAADLQVPLLLIHGDADPIMPAEGSLAFFKSVKIEDKALKLYEGGYHQAFIDSNREQVLADVAEWLDQHA